jgi:phosphate transport system protein
MAGNRQELDRALETIEAKVIELFAIIAEDLPQATAALLRGDGDVLSGLTARQQEINGWYPQVEAMVSQQILRRAPVARDLRFLLAVLRVAGDFDRAHRLVVHIAARASTNLSADLSPACRVLIAEMGKLAAGMWRGAADAWYQRDQAAADMLLVQDADLDELCASLIAQLASGVMTVPAAMELRLVARFYERLGDHAVKVAGRVVYLAGTVPS